MGYGKRQEALAKRKWQEADLQYLEHYLEQDERTYNSMQLAQKLEQERLVQLSADRIRYLLQKRALGGNARDERHQAKQDTGYKQAQLDALKHVAYSGYIELMYLDGPGCQLLLSCKV